ncbi:hypothetical protein like AT4G29090 [Hibiscus trionum]|uniref:RNase H type-1 domain-containing protein n=1 Tax=Hibiscus trionum TaxID=183268 RepID=A0A9W7LHL1_HIBTR|nr:hypothetical protein like AT4G29090 [Hibiscus trionum]
MNSQDLLRDYLSAQTDFSTTRQPATTALSPPVWRPPPIGSIKINVDGAFHPSTGAAGIGIVARDAEGTLLLGRATYLDTVADSTSAELQAISAGVLLGVEAGWQGFILESDAALLINRLCRAGEDASTLRRQLQDIRSLIDTVSSLRLHYVPREANTLAHSVANWALHFQSSMYFGPGLPDALRTFVPVVNQPP